MLYRCRRSAEMVEDPEETHRPVEAACHRQDAALQKTFPTGRHIRRYVVRKCAVAASPERVYSFVPYSVVQRVSNCLALLQRILCVRWLW